MAHPDIYLYKHNVTDFICQRLQNTQPEIIVINGIYRICFLNSDKGAAYWNKTGLLNSADNNIAVFVCSMQYLSIFLDIAAVIIGLFSKMQCKLTNLQQLYVNGTKASFVKGENSFLWET